MKALNLTGSIYGNLTVLSSLRKNNRIYWLCECSCGELNEVQTGNLTGGKTNSCGCREQMKTHGMTKTKAYHIWQGAKNRCFNKNNDHYHRYGGRGISMCDDWANSFESFYEHIGDMPSENHEIDRIDNNKNYEPKNVRWTTRHENNINRIDSLVYVINGTHHLSAKLASIKHSVSTRTIHAWCKGVTTRGKYYPPKEGCSSYGKY